jgi:hypothetical protein
MPQPHYYAKMNRMVVLAVSYVCDWLPLVQVLSFPTTVDFIVDRSTQAIESVGWFLIPY